MLCRVGANLVFALFLCGVGFIRTRISQIGANGRNSIVFVILPPPLSFRTPPFCHSEHREESREGKE